MRRSSNTIRKLYEAHASGEPSVKLSVYSPPDLTRPTFEDATSHKFKPTKTGESFGPSWSTHWFKVQLTLPKDIKDKKHLEFHWDSNSEGLVWSQDGEPLQGLTGGGERVEWILPKAFRDGREHIFYVEMACNGMFGNPMGGDTIQPPQVDRYFKLSKAEVVAVNLQARALLIDFWIIGGKFSGASSPSPDCGGDFPCRVANLDRCCERVLSGVMGATRSTSSLQ